MLRIIFGEDGLHMENKISYVSEYFDAQYEQSWLPSASARNIIQTVDRSEYVSGEYIESPVLGGISPRDLSTGCKALLILLNEPDVIVSGDRMGDNCYPLLFEMASERDLTITLCHHIDFRKFVPFEVLDVKQNKVISDPIEIYKSMYLD